MNCAEFKESVVVFALGALEHGERADFEGAPRRPRAPPGLRARLPRRAGDGGEAVRAAPGGQPAGRALGAHRAAGGGRGARGPGGERGAAAPAPGVARGARLAVAAAAAVALISANGQLRGLRAKSTGREQALAQARSTALADAQASRVGLAGCREQVAALQQGGSLQRDALALMDDQQPRGERRLSPARPPRPAPSSTSPSTAPSSSRRRSHPGRAGTTSCGSSAERPPPSPPAWCASPRAASRWPSSIARRWPPAPRTRSPSRWSPPAAAPPPPPC